MTPSVICKQVHNQAEIHSNITRRVNPLSFTRKIMI